MPISGGSGNSIDDPIKIEPTGLMTDFVGTEYAIIKYLSIIRGLITKPNEQGLLFHGEKVIDKITCMTLQKMNEEMVSSSETYFFDITDVYGLNL